MEEVPILINQAAEDCIDLPPGFRFHPTDEEIITHYLSKKVLNIKFSATAIGEVDLNKCEPWDLPSKFSFFYLFNLIYFSMHSGLSDCPTEAPTVHGTGGGGTKTILIDCDLYLINLI